MPLNRVVPFLLAAACYSPVAVFGQSGELREGLMQLAGAIMAPLQDAAQASALSQSVSKMGKSKLDALVEVISICSSTVDCTPQLESYKIKYMESSEEKILNALQVANNQYKPSSATQFPSLADNYLYIFKLRVQPAIKQRYSQL